MSKCCRCGIELSVDDSFYLIADEGVDTLDRICLKCYMDSIRAVPDLPAEAIDEQAGLE